MSGSSSGSDELRDEIAKFIRGSAGYNFALNITEGEAEGIAEGLVTLVVRRIADAKTKTNNIQKAVHALGLVWTDSELSGYTSMLRKKELLRRDWPQLADAVRVVIRTYLDESPAATGPTSTQETLDFEVD